VRLIAPYDQITEQRITTLHEKVAGHLIDLQYQIAANDTSRYDPLFYRSAFVDLAILKARAMSVEKNDIVVNQVLLIESMIKDMESLEKIGFVDAEQVIALDQPFTSAFASMIKLQNALKENRNE